MSGKQHPGAGTDAQWFAAFDAVHEPDAVALEDGQMDGLVEFPAECFEQGASGVPDLQRGHRGQPDELVNSLLRGLAVLEALSAANGPLSLSELTEQTGMTRATTRRLALTLSDIGYVSLESPGFRLCPAVMELGDAYLDALELPALARPHLEALAAIVRDTCSLTVLDGADVVYVERVKASRLMRVDIEVGSRFPAFATSTGRVLLAGLTEDRFESYLDALRAEPFTVHTRTSTDLIRQEVERARRDGWVIADQELDLSMRSVAAPVIDASGRTVAAINIASHVSRAGLDEIRAKFVGPIRTAAERISRDLARSMVD